VKSILIEFYRFGDFDTGILRKGDDYLVAAASRPVREFTMPISHKPFLDLMQALRFAGGTAQAKEALAKVSETVTGILGVQNLPDLSTDETVQLDLVVNAAELAALPFEAATRADGTPLLAQQDRAVELTRRVRQDFAEVTLQWPAQPRVLFAWAAPMDAGEVPFREHEAALRKALEPWMPFAGSDTAAATGEVLSVLPRATLDGIKAACESTRFSHVHILAHGYPMGKNFDQRFGLALHKPDDDYAERVTPEALCEALEPLRGQPVILSLAACDSANQTNTIIPEHSIAHELHVSGIPVVVASQLPLTVAGSTVFVTHFYTALLDGTDVREALHKARCALFAAEETGHDWASIVAYVRLPEGYREHLLEVQLKAALISLKTIQGSTDELIARQTAVAAEFDGCIGLLDGRLKALERCLEKAASAAQKGILEENLGLLGSAEKRLAELYFERGRREDSGENRERMRKALERSHGWYEQAFHRNTSHHWTGVQALSLQAVLTGAIPDAAYWHAAAVSAGIDRKRPDEVWALGSLAELYLLAPAAGLPDQIAKSIEVLEEMKRRVGSGNRFPLESTARQFRRYVQWWTSANGFFPGRTDFSVPARRLCEVLK
jgi:hypothetical protein